MAFKITIYFLKFKIIFKNISCASNYVSSIRIPDNIAI